VSTTGSIRAYVESAIEDGRDLDEIADEAVVRFGADPDVVQRIVRQGINREVRSIYGQITQERARDPARLRAEIAKAAPDSPWATLALSPRIELDVANMTKLEVMSLAGQCEDEAGRAHANAGFLRVVASQMSDTETVAERFALDDLVRIKSRITVTPKSEVYFGNRRLTSNGRAL